MVTSRRGEKAISEPDGETLTRTARSSPVEKIVKRGSKEHCLAISPALPATLPCRDCGKNVWSLGKGGIEAAEIGGALTDGGG